MSNYIKLKVIRLKVLGCLYSKTTRSDTRTVKYFLSELMKVELKNTRVRPPSVLKDNIDLEHEESILPESGEIRMLKNKKKPEHSKFSTNLE